MAATQFAIFHTFKVRFGQALINLSTDDIKCALLSSAWTPDLANNAGWADISAHEISGDGYTAGGLSVTNASWANAAGVATFDCDDPAWTAGASGISARYAVFYDNTDANKTLICYSLFDDSPADFAATDGQTFKIVLPASGVFQAS